MPIKILYGDSRTDLTIECFKRMEIFEKEHPEKRCFLIVPETAKLDTECEYLAFNEKKGMMKTEILSFSRFCSGILEEAGYNDIEYVDETGQAMLAYRILRKNTEKFPLYRHLASKPGFTSGLVSVLGEMNRFLIDGQMLGKAAAGITDPVLSRKTGELSLLLEKYKESLEILDMKEPSDNYTLAKNHIEELCGISKENKKPHPGINGSRICGASIFISGFAQERNFTPQEFSIIKALDKICDVTVTVAGDPGCFKSVSREYMRDFFYAGCKTAELIGKDIGIDGSPFFIPPKRDKIFSHLCEKLKNSVPEKMYLKGEDERKINIINALSVREEISIIAGEIKNLVTTEKIRYKDIFITVPDKTIYYPLVAFIFRQAGIPVYAEEKKSLYNTALGKYIESLFEMAAYGFDTDSTVDFLKNPLNPCPIEEADEFENFALARGIKYNCLEYIEKHCKGQEDKKYSFIREKYLMNAVKFKEKADKCLQTGDFCKALSDFSDSEQLSLKTKETVKKYLNAGEDDAAIAIAKAWNKNLQLTEQAYKIGKKTPMDIEGFREMYMGGMKNSFSGTVPSFVDQVRLSCVENIPLKKFKIVFAAGLSEDEFPGKACGEGILKDSDRELLSGFFGMKLPSVMSDKAYEDRYIAFSFLTLPEERLYLSSPKPKEKQSEIIYFVRDCFEGYNEINTKEIPDPFDPHIYSPESAIIAIKNGLCSKNENVKKNWRETYKVLIKNDELKRKLDMVFSAQRKKERKIALLGEDILKRYAIPPVIGVTQIENYSRCAFLHYAENLLGLLPRKMHEITRADTGTILHAITDECVSEFIGEYKKAISIEDKNLVLKKYKERDYDSTVSEKIRKLAERQGDNTILEKGNFACYGRKTGKLAAATLKGIFAGVNEKDFLPAQTEWDFSEKNKTALGIQISESVKVYLRGIIDRIDIKGDGFRIVDYKSADKRIDYDEIYNGMSLQLPLYIAAYKNIHPGMNPADAGYFRFSREISNCGNLPEYKIDATQKKEFEKEYRIRGMDMAPGELTAVAEYSVNTIESLLKKIFRGEYCVNPKKTQKTQPPCVYCNYSPLCGFEPGVDEAEILPGIIKKDKDGFVGALSEKLKKENPDK